jgi:hypothetical protein
LFIIELMITTALAFVVALVVRRREALKFRWRPTRHTWAAVGSGLLAFALSGSLLLLDEGSLLARLILYGGIFFGCGFALPWGYTLLVERKGPAARGTEARTMGRQPGHQPGLGHPIQPVDRLRSRSAGHRLAGVR